MELLTKARLFKGIYEGKKVLLTGHTGFKGSWMSLWLNELGAELVGYSIDDCGEESHFNQIGPKGASYLEDVRNKARVMEVFAEHQPEIVFHMAAQPLVRASYKDPSFTYETNVIGTLNVLEAARHCGSVRAIVNITTDKVYENLEVDRGYQETDRLGGYDPYSSSKACAEILTASYRNSFAREAGMLLASVRAGNVIGGGDWSEDRLIPDLIRAARAGTITEIRSPQATRPWQHVLDPLSGYLMLGQRLLEGETAFATGWNFGPYKSANIQVIEVLNKMQAQWDKIQYQINEEEAKKFHEAKLLMLDCSKAHNDLGWTPTWDINTSMEKTANWYKAYCDQGEVISVQQLHTFWEDAKVAEKSWVSA